jgi:hypothetical protein
MAGIAPNALVLFGGGIGLASARPGLFSPLVHLLWVQSIEDSLVANTYHLHVAYTGGHALLCPSTFAAMHFAFRPCISALFGLVSVSADDTYLPQSSHDLQAGIGPTAMLSWDALQPLVVEIFATAWVPVWQLRYFDYSSGHLLFETPAVGAMFGVHIGLSLP